MPEQSKEIQEGKFFAAISYISFFCVVSLLLKKNNKFSACHAKQGLVLFVMEVLTLIFSVIPVLGSLIKFLGIILFGIISLWGILQSIQGISKRIPVISGLADKIVL